VIYGQVNNTTGIYDASGINAFTLTVNSATGDVTLDQIRAITHQQVVTHHQMNLSALLLAQ
jgi:hypothetical protein